MNVFNLLLNVDTKLDLVSNEKKHFLAAPCVHERGVVYS